MTWSKIRVPIMFRKVPAGGTAHGSGRARDCHGHRTKYQEQDQPGKNRSGVLVAMPKGYARIFIALAGLALGSGLVDHSQKMTVAARAIAEK
ncbi:hypothetical protein, partial [Sphingomonas molluscorum]|uniref:hypothetical protein n=1 Tax=Sphingomonas molluscorum TaxID=418184 RepID=UPI0031D0CB79